MIEKLIKLLAKIYGRFILRFKKVSGSEEIYQTVRKLNDKAALYVHVPFCRSQCKYCTFLKFDYEINIAQKYFACLKKELDIYLSLGVKFSEIYIGGGTPTINIKELVAFINCAKEKTGVQDISVETTLEDANEGNLNALKQAGATILSIGLQSIHQSHRTIMERTDLDVTDAREKINRAAQIFETVNVDFIFNLPAQTLDELKEELDFFLSLENVKGTFYPLLPADSKDGNAFSKIDLKKQKEYYYFIRDTLHARGFEPLTTWCFSKNNQASSEYIIHSENYIGIGCGSISQVNRMIYTNTFSLEKYFQLLENGLAVVVKKDISTWDAARYRLLLFLFSTKADDELMKKKRLNLLPELLLVKMLGWVKRKGQTTYATRKGMYYIGFTMREFFNSVADLRKKGIDEGL